MAADGDEATPKDSLQLVYITALIIIAVVVLFLLHVLGSVRRRSSHKALHAIVLGAYTLSYSLVSYTLGLMQESRFYFAEFPVWAVCLLMLLGGTDNLMACKLDDVDNWKDYHVKHLLKGVLVVYIVAYYGQNMPEYQRPLWAILCVNVLQSCVRIKSMRMASKSNLLSKNVKPIVDHMEHDSGKGKDIEFDPISMEGCKYIVSGEHGENKNGEEKVHKSSMGKLLCLPKILLSYWSCSNKKESTDKKKVDEKIITTVEEIWQCEGSLLLSKLGMQLKERNKQLKDICSERGMQLKDMYSERGMKLMDICLSMALSKMLNRRFAGFKLAEAGLNKTHAFVFKGLLAGNKQDPGNKQDQRNKACERTFKVIEVELGFVYDLYYTRYPYLYHKVRHFALCLPVAMVIFCSWLTYVLFKKHREGDDNISICTTRFLMAIVTFLEAFQLYLHIASNWFKVALIRSYVKRPALQCCFFKMIISLVLRLEVPRPWENKLGQYSLLQDYNKTRHISNCIHYLTLGLVDQAKKGCKRGKLVKLSTEVKQAVIGSLIGSNGYLTKGERSLANHTQLLWACKFGTVTETILVWHVATTICKHKFDAALGKDTKQTTMWRTCLATIKLKKDAKKTAPLSDQDGSSTSTVLPNAVLTASSLSQYCAYLVAFAPDLLPGHSFESTSTLKKSIADALNYEPLKGAKTMEDKCKELLSISDTNNNDDAQPDAGGDKPIEDAHSLPDLQQREIRVSISDTNSNDDSIQKEDATPTKKEDARPVADGARLARQLMEKFPDSRLQWKLLSDFWAEMMLYVAPCDDAKARAHLEALPRGGEFITHLWALLNHAGVLEPDRKWEPKPAQTVTGQRTSDRSNQCARMPM